MFFKLSIKNIVKSFKDYSIYFMTLIFGVCIFYVFNSLEAQTAMAKLSVSQMDMIKVLVEIIGYISVFVSFILGFLIIYANNFLIRRRKKELGLYMTLGMSKAKISKLLLIETIIIGIISLVIGLGLGVFISQFMSVIIANMFNANLDKYSFIFSKGAAIKTCIYFGIIYLLVMCFNIISISRYKLINLLNASKKNQKAKMNNQVISVITFIVSIALIGGAYYLLKHDALMYIDNKFLAMILLGTVGTFLFISSLTGFVIKMIQMNKKIYLKNLNMFILRQLNSRINTSTISMTVISLMLLLTIGILSASLAMKDSFNIGLTNNNLTDVTLNQSVTEESEKSIIEQLEADGLKYTDYFKECVEYTTYETVAKESSLLNYFGAENLKKISTEMPIKESEFGNMGMQVMKETEYNKLMGISKKEDFKIKLKEDEYIVVSNFEKMSKVFDELLKNKTPYKINNKEFKPALSKTIDVANENSSENSNMGIIVLPDKEIVNVKPIKNIVVANFIGDSKEVEPKFIKAVNESNKKETHRRININAREDIQDNAAGLSIMVTFIGIYLGIIFTITSAAVLAIAQLSESSDNKERYAVLRKIGVDDRMINKSLFIQIGIFFMFPLSVGFIHSVFGLSEVNKLIAMFGKIDITKNIVLTTVFIVIVYGGYFIATYLGSKSIIKEKEKNVD
ncbi:MAG: FtsX-like permease family protein [Clostridia bacterium]